MLIPATVNGDFGRGGERCPLPQQNCGEAKAKYTVDGFTRALLRLLAREPGEYEEQMQLLNCARFARVLFSGQGFALDPLVPP